MEPNRNRAKYESDDVVAFYEKQTALQPVEAYLFEKYIPKDATILDMGVGGGRTTPSLASRATRYVGADYSSRMVDSCKARYPHLDFRCCDATEMTQFSDQEFDVVVFSFNGIDVINSDQGRLACLRETARILKPGGLFIFSSHNARVLGVLPDYSKAKPHQVVWRTIRCVGKSIQLTVRALSSNTFVTAQGYIIDPVHGGMDHYVSTPKTMIPQLNSVGFEVLECAGGPNHRIQADYLKQWHYYLCRKK